MDIKKVTDFIEKIRSIPRVSSELEFDKRGYSDHDRNLIRTASKNLELFDQYLEKIRDSKEDLSTKDFIKHTKNVNKNILYYQKKLLQLKNAPGGLDAPENKIAAQVCIEIIQINIQQLDVLAKIAQCKLQAQKDSKLYVNEEDRANMGQALFNNDKDKLLARLHAFVHYTDPFKHKKVAIADQLKEILGLGTEIRDQCAKAALPNNANTVVR